MTSRRALRPSSLQPKKMSPRQTYSIATLLLHARVISILLTFWSPFQSLIAWQVLCGRSVVSCALEIQRLLFRSVGWMSARPVGGQILRKWLFPIIDIRRFHVVAGALCFFVSLWTLPSSLTAALSMQCMRRNPTLHACHPCILKRNFKTHLMIYLYLA